MEQMVKYIEEYYTSEKTSAFMLMLIALLMLALSYILYSTLKSNVVYGIIIGLVPLAIIQTIAGIFIVFRAGFRHKVLVAKINGNKILDIKPEAERMTVEVKRLHLTRKIQEITFGFAFVGIFLGMAKVINPIGMGLAMALLLQAAVMIAYDLFAVRRAEEYARRLRRA